MERTESRAPMISHQGPLAELPNKELWVSRIKAVEFKNFMRFDNISYSFMSENFVCGLRSTGKTTIVLAILLGLGQDEVINFFGYNNIQDLIKRKTEIAIIKLTVAIPPNSDLRNMYGDTLQIIRKIQVQDGKLLGPIWRTKKVLNSNSMLASSDYISRIYEQLEFPKLSGVPFIITQNILKFYLTKSSQYWYTEFERLMGTIIRFDYKRNIFLAAEIDKLKKEIEDFQLFQTSNPEAVTEETILLNYKRKVQLEIKNKEMEETKAKVNIAERKCAEEFEKFYANCCSAMGVDGLCSVDSERKEINFGVDAYKFTADKKAIKRRYRVSSKRNKMVALSIAILGFWKTTNMSPIYMVENAIDSIHMKRFFQSAIFKDMVMEKKRVQFFVTGLLGWNFIWQPKIEPVDTKYENDIKQEKQQKIEK